MKNWLLAILVAAGSAMALAPLDADARRFGGGASKGMQRSLPTSTPAKPAAPQQAAPTSAGAAPAAAAAKRSWMGPIAGLAAGLGLAALMSHLGLGEEFANFLMIALLVMVAVVAVRLLMRRFNPAPASANAAGMAGGVQRINPAAAWDKPGLPSGAIGAAATPLLPAGFDAEEFARIAKTIFIRMQAANDTADLNDLRNFTTPEMFANVKLDLQERGNQAQTTDVVKVDAEVLDFEQEGERQVVSVRFHGQIREDVGAPAQDFDEVWHLVRWGDNPAWSIAGIQQREVLTH
jgi:predicted lipid-binding transport protein (Tim44 family)